LRVAGRGSVVEKLRKAGSCLVVVAAVLKAEVVKLVANDLLVGGENSWRRIEPTMLGERVWCGL
jgi:hypothetical protein